MKIILATLIVFVSIIKLSYSLSCMCEGYECAPAIGCTGNNIIFQFVSLNLFPVMFLEYLS